MTDSTQQQPTITEFLEARIAEDERAAQIASPGPWSYSDIESVGGGTIYDPEVAIAGVQWDTEHVDRRIRRTVPSGEANATGRHIARHDPSRVLAECAAKRALLDIDFLTSAVLDNHRVLAAIYKDHPDYKQEWSIRG